MIVFRQPGCGIGLAATKCASPLSSRLPGYLTHGNMAEITLAGFVPASALIRSMTNCKSHCVVLSFAAGSYMFISTVNPWSIHRRHYSNALARACLLKRMLIQSISIHAQEARNAYFLLYRKQKICWVLLNGPGCLPTPSGRMHAPARRLRVRSSTARTPPPYHPTSRLPQRFYPLRQPSSLGRCRARLKLRLRK